MSDARSGLTRAPEALNAEPRTAALAAILLTRMAPDGGATRAECVREFAPWLAPTLLAAEAKSAIEREIGTLVDSGQIKDTRGRLTVTDTGTAAAAKFLGLKLDGSEDWATLRDTALIAKALGLKGESLPRLTTLADAEGLRTAIVQRAFGLKGKRTVPASKLRAQLAVVALERAFGNKLKAGFGKGSSLSSKAARTLAGQLLRSPREISTDAKLVAALAADFAGVPEGETDQLRLGLFRRLVAVQADIPKPAPDRPAPPKLVVSKPANDVSPVALPSAAEAPVQSRPGLAEFSRDVLSAAQSCAQGWPGNRKAFISQVWDAIRARRAGWNVTEIEFKCMLAEAHRQGALVLSNADLKDKAQLALIERSATAYKNTVWHFVRVED